MPGWIDNLYGPIAVLYGAAFGILHITLLNLKAQAGIVPVDYCVNMVLTCAWNTAPLIQVGATQQIEVAVGSTANLERKGLNSINPISS